MTYDGASKLLLQRNTTIYNYSAIYYFKHKGINEYLLFYFYRCHRNFTCISKSNYIFKFPSSLYVYNISSFFILKPCVFLYGIFILQIWNKNYDNHVDDIINGIFICINTCYMTFFFKFSKLKCKAFA